MAPILITQTISASALPLLGDFEIRHHRGETPISRDRLLEWSRGCQAIIPMPTDRIDAEVMDAAGSSLKVIAHHAVGFDNIDLEAAKERQVVVSNTPGVLTEATADLAMALMLGAARHIVEGDRMIRRGEFKGWRPDLLVGHDLFGQKLGIVGMGRIGRATAERAKAFGLHVAHHSRSGGAPLIELLKTSDIVSLHCPLNDTTRHLIDAKALELMKPTAILINTARGPVVDEGALAVALRDGQIAAAGLDVFEEEPEEFEVEDLDI
ncbi:MAG: D-glycerate dehydrogenase, partial [Proteobacteria bacterium]|nr:D-glycerate dehydrogenase [Pseudomonadota bacterium]